VLKIKIRNSFMFAYGSWHPESHLCCPNKFSDGEIQKWHISSGFIYPELCYFTYGYKYLENKNLKSLRTKWTFHVSVLGANKDMIWCRQNQLLTWHERPNNSDIHAGPRHPLLHLMMEGKKKLPQLIMPFIIYHHIWIRYNHYKQNTVKERMKFPNFRIIIYLKHLYKQIHTK